MRHSTNNRFLLLGATSLYGACALLYLVSSTPLLAQEAPNAGRSASSQDSLDEIVVTAQKRTENVQDVPKAVDVLTKANLEQAGINNLQELSRVDPSIQGLSATEFAPPSIRGISSFAFSIGVQTQTGIVLDDVPQPSFSTLASELSDVERVEVLPGPQSTLSGRNSAGGLINIVTHNPTNNFTGTLNLEQTDDHQTRVAGFLSGPLSDTLAFSLSGFYDKWDGNIVNVAENNQLINGFNQHGIRGKLQWRPTTTFTATLTGYYTKGDFLTTAIIDGSPFVYAAPGAGFVFIPGQTLAQLHPGAAVRPYSDQISTPGHGVASNENKGVNLRLDYDSNIGTVSSITSYSRGNQPRNDLFVGVPLAPSVIVHAYTDTDVKYFTQELRLTSGEAQDKLKYTAGLIYTDTDNFEPYNRPILFPVNWDRDARIRSVAAYGRGTYEFVKDTSLTLGLRSQHDASSYDWVFLDGLAPESKGSNDYDFVAGEASLQHNFNRDVKGYFTYANAQTGRVYDLEDNGSAETPAGLQPLASQKVHSYEAGLKTQLFDRKLTANISIFRADYSNYQVQSLSTGSANSVPVIRLLAIGRVQTQGIELSSDLAVTKNLHLGLNASILDAKILDYPGAACFPGQTAAQGCVAGLQDRRGVLPGTSKFRTAISANYILPLPTLPADVTFGAFYRYQSSTAFDVLGDPVEEEGGYGILNLSVGLKSHANGLSGELFVNNATNRHYYSSITDDTLSPAPATEASYGRDSFRYFGVRIGFHF